MIDKKIAVVYIATNGYSQYAEAFIDSSAYFFPHMDKHFFILTDDSDLLNLVEGKEKYTAIPMMDLIYPCINVNKTYILEQIKGLEEYDYVAYFDADTVFIDRTDYNWDGLQHYMDNNFFCMGCHPFYNLSDSDETKKPNIDTLFDTLTEKDETQQSYIPYDEYTYVISSFFCANYPTFMNVCKKVTEMTRIDMTRYNRYRIPLFMDENYFNKLVSACEKGDSNEFNFKVGNYILMGNSDNQENLLESFIYQKNMHKEYKKHRR